MVWAGVLLLRLRKMLHVADAQWWFDDSAEGPGAWVSLLGYGDGYVEVIPADGQGMRFASRADGERWLEEQGCVPARRAVEEHIVRAMPPDVLMAARPRDWLRAARGLLHAARGASGTPGIEPPPIVAGAAGFSELRYWLRPAAQQWWLDKQTRTAGEWVSLLVFRDKAEVLRTDEKLAFESEQKAVEWLEKNGYLPAERAIEDGLASDVPPDPTTQAPRMRVASDASEREAHEAAEAATGDGDELDQDAGVDTDDADSPRRAAAGEDPHDPRD